MTFIIDREKIESDLQELAGSIPLKVKLNKRLATRAGHPLAYSVRETDKGQVVTLNPGKIRSQPTLEEKLNQIGRGITAYD